VLSDNAMSVLVPVLEEVLHWDSPEIRRFFASRGLGCASGDKMRTDMLTIEENFGAEHHGRIAVGGC